MRVTASSAVTYRHQIVVTGVPDDKPVVLFASNQYKIHVAYEIPVAISYRLVDGHRLERPSEMDWSREKHQHPVRVDFNFGAAWVRPEGVVADGTSATIYGHSLNRLPVHIRDLIIDASERMMIPGVREATALSYRGVRDDIFLNVPQDLGEAVAWREDRKWFIPRGAPKLPTPPDVEFAPARGRT